MKKLEDYKGQKIAIKELVSKFSINQNLVLTKIKFFRDEKCILFYVRHLFNNATSATTVSAMTFKPSTPKYTIVVSSWDTDGLNHKIKPYIKNGYIVKTISAGDNARVALLEKY